MATYDELMAALRKADAAGDTEAAKAIARQARAMKGLSLSTPEASSPQADAPIPSLPQDPVQQDFTAQIANLMAAPVQQTGMGPRVAAPAMPAQTPAWIEQAVAAPQPAPVPVAAPTPQAVDPMAAIAQAMGGQQSVSAVARNLDQFFPGSDYSDVMQGGPQMPPQAPAPVVAPVDPFAGEGFGDLAKRRGQQFVAGAAEVGASVPEALAIMGAQADASRVRGATETGTQRAAMIADMQAALADPAIPEDQKAIIARNMADLNEGQGVIAGMAAEPVVPAQDRPLFKAGDTARKAVEGVVGKPDPRDTGFWGQVAQGAGNMTGMIAASLVGGAAGGPVGAMATGAASGSMLNAPSLYKEAIEAGATEEVAQQAARWGAAIGASEIVPITRALKILPPRLRGELTTGMLRKFTDIAQSAGEEAAQEYLATVANNITAQQLFDADRGWTEGATEAALVGAVLGGGVGAIGTAMEGRGATRPPREREDEAPPVNPIDQIAAAMQPPAPDAAPALPQAERRPQTPAQPDPMAQITAAMTGQPAPTAKPAVDKKAGMRAELVDWAAKVKGSAIPAGSQAARQMDDMFARAKRAGLTDDEIDDALSGKSQPAPLAQITAAMGSQAPQSGQNGQTITRAEVEADPDRYEIVDEAEGQGANWRTTGGQVVVDKQTGQAIPLAPDTAAAPPPAVAGAPGGADSAGMPQAAPEQGNGDVPAVAGAAPNAAPRQKGQPERRFLTNEETLSIQTDAKAFQYKGGGDEAGVTDRLRGVSKFDPVRAGQVILFRKADGSLTVADGHQRTGLAKRAAEAGQADVGGMAAVIYDEADGYTPEKVMVIAALKNIGEGSGTALDAARILRNTEETVEDLGLPPRSALVRDADGLRRLSPTAFGMVANGKASERDGAVVGRVVQDQAVQADILALLTRINPPNAAQAEMIARDAAADTATETQDDLFGTEQVAQSLYVERAKILDGAVKELRKNKAAFNVLLKNGAKIEGAGNKLDQDANAAQVQQDAMVLEYVQRQATMKGPISDALTAAARAVKAGQSIADARRTFVQDVIRGLEGGGASGQTAPVGGSETADQTERPAPQQVETQGGEAELPQGDQRDDNAAAGDLFGGPAPDPMGQIVAAMTGQAQATPPDDGDLFGATPQTGKTPDQIRAEAEAETRKNQSKIRKAGGNDGDAGPLFDGQGDMLVGGKAKEWWSDLPKSERPGGVKNLQVLGGFLQVNYGDFGTSVFFIPGENQQDVRVIAEPKRGRSRAEIEAIIESYAPFDGFDITKRAGRFPTTLEAIASGPKNAGRLTHIYAEYRGKRYYLASVPGMPGAAIGAWLKTFPQEGLRILSTDRADGTSINGEVPELEAAIAERAQDTAQSFTAGIEAAKQKFTRPGEAVTLPDFSDLSATARGKQLIADMADAKGFAARKKLADAWVFERGRVTGVEHLVGIDSAGRPMLIGSGSKSAVGFPWYVQRMQQSGELVYLTHNHPSSRGASQADLRVLLQGKIGGFGIMAHNGRRYEVARGPMAQDLRIPDDGQGVADFDALDRSATAELKKILDRRMVAVKRDDVEGNAREDRKAKAANGAFHAILNLVYDRLGLLTVTGDMRAAALEGTDGDADLDQIIADVAGRIPDDRLGRLGRLGLDVATIRAYEQDRGVAAYGGDPAGSGGADAAAGGAGTGNGKRGDRGENPAVTSGNADLDGALDDLFGDENDVSGTGTDLERPGGDGATADDVGAGDVSPAARPSGRGTGRRGRKAASGDGQRPASSGIPDGDASAVGSGGNPGTDGGTGTDSQPAASGNGGRRNGGGDGRLPSDGAGKGNTAGNASGSPAKLTPAQRLAAIRNVLKENALDFVAGPDRRDDEARAFAASLKAELGLRDLSMFVSGGGDIRLSMIAVPRDQQGNGIGTEAMQRIVDFANERGMRITLSVGQPDDGFGTTSRARLVRFYKRFGFVENAGRNKDFAMPPGMYRNPRAGGMMEETVPAIDPRKAEALQSIFVGALEGVNPAQFTDRQIFASIILPLRDAGMTRAEVAELSPYLTAFLADLRAGRVNLDPDAELIAPSRDIEAGDRAEKQAAADKIKVKPVDRENIDATLPLLLPEQRDDVFKVETRFAKPDGHGMLITNGTGTGKTFSGGGVIKRFVQQGKTNVLIIAPSDAVIAGWTRALEALAVPVSQLRNTKDAGRGVVITTYANLRANNMLASRDWDLVVTDESQNLLSNATGDATSYLQNLRAITKRPNDFWHLVRMRHADEIAKLWPKSEAKNMRRASDAVVPHGVV